VLEVRWRQTTIETRNWETVVVPNSFLVKNSFMILGRRQGEPLQWRRLITFHVDYRYSPTQVIGTVEEAVRRAPIPGVASEPLANCVLMDMRDSFHTYTLRYWLTDLQRDDPTDSLVRTRIFFALKRAGIPLTMPAHAIFVTSDSEDRRTRKAHDLDQSRQKVLREAELFRNLTPDEVDELAEGLRFAPFSAGEVLTTQGSVGHDLYLVHQGKVSIRVSAGGIDTEVAQLGAGSFFGERSLMTGEKRSATTVALTDVVCYRLAKEQLESILKRRPELAEQVAEVLARRAHELDARRKDLTDAARERAIAQESHQFVARIKHFFGL
jgi:CRP-like cAMP-binding protein